MGRRQTYDWGGGRMSPEQVAQVLYQAGFRGQALVNMLAIGGRESGYRPGIHGTASARSRVSGDRGLFQINSVNDAALRRAGIIRNPADLFNPVVNARAAFFLSHGGSNLFPWGAGSGGWRPGGDPFHNTNREAAAAAVERARQAGLLGRDWDSTSPTTPTNPQPSNDLTQVRHWMDAQQNLFKAWLATQPIAKQQEYVTWLKANHTPTEIAAFLRTAPPDLSHYISNFLTALPDATRRAQVAQLHAGDPPPAPATPAPSPELTNLLRTFGVNYANAPQPTPALLAFLNGLNLSLGTTEQQTNQAIARVNASAADAQSDITRAAGRTKQNITADVVRRGVLSSGEANTRYARQSEDVAASRADVSRIQSQSIQQAQETYQQAQQTARQQALDRVIGTEQQQQTDAATSRAQEQARHDAQTAADLAWARQQAAQQQAEQSQLDDIRRAAARGVAV